MICLIIVIFMIVGTPASFRCHPEGIQLVTGREVNVFMKRINGDSDVCSVFNKNRNKLTAKVEFGLTPSLKAMASIKTTTTCASPPLVLSFAYSGEEKKDPQFTICKKKILKLI